jgi:prepilin signal peptidase PulO-like enzyme (type II secretory pathway)
MSFSMVALGLVYGVWYSLMACLFSDIVLQIRDMRWKEEEDRAGLIQLGFGAMAEGSDGRKPLLEIFVSSLIYAALFIYLSSSHLEIRESLFLFVLVSYGLMVSLIDIRRHLILLSFNLAGAILGILFGIWRGALWTSALGGGINLLVMFLFYWMGKKVGYFSRKAEDGAPMGFGDVLYSGVLGLFLGFPQSYLGIMIGAIAGIILIGGELVRAAVTKTKRKAIPFAPAFTIGVILVALFYLVV